MDIQRTFTIWPNSAANTIYGETMIKDHLKLLDKLYTITGDDWVLHISHILTEPVCPTVIIKPERSNISRYRVDAGSIEESIEMAAKMVHKEIVLREKVGSSAPYTNSDDKLFLEWLEKRWAGSDDKLPYFDATFGCN